MRTPEEWMGLKHDPATAHANILELALEFFEDQAQAERWIEEKQLILCNRSAKDLLVTEEGFNIVRTVLVRMLFGDFGALE